MATAPIVPPVTKEDLLPVIDYLGILVRWSGWLFRAFNGGRYVLGEVAQKF